MIISASAMNAILAEPIDRTRSCLAKSACHKALYRSVNCETLPSSRIFLSSVAASASAF